MPSRQRALMKYCDRTGRGAEIVAISVHILQNIDALQIPGTAKGRAPRLSRAARPANGVLRESH